MNVPLPWERLLWSGRPLRARRVTRGERYLLTDFRLVRDASDGGDEIALDDIAEVRRIRSRLDRAIGTSTLVVRSRHRGASPVVLAGVRRGPQLAALVELVAADPAARIDVPALQAAVAWTPSLPAGNLRGALGGFLGVLLAIAVLFVGLHDTATPITYASDDAIAPGGYKRSQAEITRFMEREVMPWAREALAPIKGGPDRVTCATCHGPDPAARAWRMPAVAALPEPEVKERGWDRWGGGMDAQMRNAIYGYLAESEKSAKAAYMREVVLPGMAALLHRPAYDFTKSYDFNRSQNALGCYHCHRVK